MGSKFWTLGISWVLLAAYLYANTYTYLPIYVLFTSVSAYPTTHYPPPSLPPLLPTSLPSYLPTSLRRCTATYQHTHTYTPDQLAKTAARDKDKTTYYSRIPLSTLFRELEEESKLKWQQKWEESPKAALTKQFYPRITDRLKSKIDITSNFTAMVSGQGKTRAYLHRFKLLESATPCNKRDQTTDHLLYHCNLFHQ